MDIVQRSGNELKLGGGEGGLDPDALLGWNFEHFLIQPKDGEDRAASLAAAIDYVMKNPRWRLSLQQHKPLGLP